MRWSLAASLSFVAACAGATPVPHTPASAEPPPPIVTGFRYTDGPERNGDPTTRVLLVVIDEHGRRTENVGTFAGPCSPEEPESGALESAGCWWGQSEVELALVREGDALVVYRDGDVELLRLPLPEGIQVLTIAEANALEDEL